MPHRLHERAIRMHIADLRAVSIEENPWQDHPHAHTFAPLMVAGSHAFADILEHFADTNPGAEAYDLVRGMLHSFESTVPAPFDAVAWPCQCDLADAPHHDANIRGHFTLRRVERGLKAPLSIADMPTEPIGIVAAA